MGYSVQGEDVPVRRLEDLRRVGGKVAGYLGVVSVA